MPRGNASNSIYGLLDEPLVGEMIDHIPAETLQEIVDVCRGAQHALRAALAGSRASLAIEEMIYSAEMMVYAARKLQASQAIKADLAALAQGEAKARERLRSGMAALRDLDGELVDLTQEFRKVWLRRARRGEMSITLGHLSRLRERYALAQDWLAERLAQLEAGEAPDYDLSGYAEEAQSYEILGQGFWKRMRKAGVSLD